MPNNHIRGRGQPKDTKSPGHCWSGQTADEAMSSNNKIIQQPIVDGLSHAYPPRCAAAAVGVDASDR